MARSANARKPVRCWAGIGDAGVVSGAGAVGVAEVASPSSSEIRANVSVSDSAIAALIVGVDVEEVGVDDSDGA
jgi:hypothetical protein